MTSLQFVFANRKLYLFKFLSRQRLIWISQNCPHKVTFVCIISPEKNADVKPSLQIVNELHLNYYPSDHRDPLPCCLNTVRIYPSVVVPACTWMSLWVCRGLFVRQVNVFSQVAFIQKEKRIIVDANHISTCLNEFPLRIRHVYIPLKKGKITM